MPKDPTIAIRDCLAEFAILHEIAVRMTLQTFRSDPIVRRAAAYAIHQYRPIAVIVSFTLATSG
jgi:hypothetical protein